MRLALGLAFVALLLLAIPVLLAVLRWDSRPARARRQRRRDRRDYRARLATAQNGDEG